MLGSRKTEAELLQEVYQKIGGNVEAVEENNKEIYKLSRMLPEDEGYRLINIYENTINNICEAFTKN